MQRFCGLLALMTALTLGASENIQENLISETPRGAVDGRNPVFTLSHYPSARTGVRLFRNGVPLNTDQYRLDGKAVTTSVENVPVPGDHMLAVYLPGASPTRAVGSDGGNDLVGAAIGDALKREEQRSSRAEYPAASKIEATRNLRSLQMLSRSVESGKSLPEVGVDGLGDITPSQPGALAMLNRKLGGDAKKPAKRKKEVKKHATADWELPK